MKPLEWDARGSCSGGGEKENSIVRMKERLSNERGQKADRTTEDEGMGGSLLFILVSIGGNLNR